MYQVITIELGGIEPMSQDKDITEYCLIAYVVIGLIASLLIEFL